MKAQIELLKYFVSERLDGEIESLCTFNLGELRKDKVYGCPGRNFDSDDTNLMRAIYQVVFGRAWNLQYDDFETGIMRGDTINTCATLLAPNDKKYYEKYIEKWQPDETFIAKRDEFLRICFTIGNMTILPNKALGLWTINKHRGCHAEWHDYEDRFLAALRLVLVGDEHCDTDLKELVELNRDYFTPFYGEEGWRHFVDSNMLEYYVDEDYIPVVASKGYTWWRGGYTNRDRYMEECNRYINFSTSVIQDRANRIVQILKEYI